MDALTQSLIQAGPMGLFVVWLIYDRREARAVEKADIEAKLALAKALTALSVIITGKAE